VLSHVASAKILTVAILLIVACPKEGRMGKVEKIENQVRALSAEELAAFRKWFREFDAEAWDREIEADALAGKLDALADRALNAHRAGKTTSL
jgi:hypothetical protein